MKKICTFILLAFFTVSVHSVEDIERLMVEKAESAQEKKAIYSYLMKESAERKKMANRLREMAKTKKGGKAQSQIKHAQEMKEEADSLDAIAKDYEELAQKVKQ